MMSNVFGTEEVKSCVVLNVKSMNTICRQWRVRNECRSFESERNGKDTSPECKNVLIGKEGANFGPEPQTERLWRGRLRIRCGVEKF